MKQQGKFAKSCDGKRRVPQLGLAASSGTLETIGVCTHRAPAEQTLRTHSHTQPHLSVKSIQINRVRHEKKHKSDSFTIRRTDKDR